MTVRKIMNTKYLSTQYSEIYGHDMHLHRRLIYLVGLYAG